MHNMQADIWINQQEGNCLLGQLVISAACGLALINLLYAVVAYGTQGFQAP
jgi:hypothetical protein